MLLYHGNPWNPPGLRYNTIQSAPPVSAHAHSRGPGARQAEGLQQAHHLAARPALKLPRATCNKQEPIRIISLNNIFSNFPDSACPRFRGVHPLYPTSNCASSTIHGSYTMSSMNLRSNALGAKCPLSQSTWWWVSKSVMPKPSHICRYGWVWCRRFFMRIMSCATILFTTVL